MAVISDHLHLLHLGVNLHPHTLNTPRTMNPPPLAEPHYGCTNMSFACVKPPFLANAERKISAGDERWDDSYPIWVPCCLMIPFGWLFRGRRWPDCSKSYRRRDWEHKEWMERCEAREQTKWPETRTSPCSLRPRGEGEGSDDLSVLDLDTVSGLEGSALHRLPLELRQEIYGYVLGREENWLVFLPFKMRAVPAGHLITRGDVTDSHFNHYKVVRDDRLFWPQRTALLRTCRQVYREAVDLLYTNNTFVVKHPKILLTLAKYIPPQRLGSIRNLHIVLAPTACLSSCYGLTLDEYRRFWDIVLGMEQLRKLHLDLRCAYLLRHPELDGRDICRQHIGHIMMLTELNEFTLNFRALRSRGELTVSDETSRLMDVMTRRRHGGQIPGRIF
ncbi:MAG: hypothetical protein Q9212_000764 [Teloschistes hypoglaucus]